MLPASCRKLANPKLLPLPEELCISFHRCVFSPAATRSWPIIDTRRNLAEISRLSHEPARSSGQAALPCPAVAWWPRCVSACRVTTEGAAVLLQEMPGVHVFCSPRAHQANTACWERPAPRETKGALCRLVVVRRRKSILGNPLALACFRLKHTAQYERLFVREVAAVSLHWSYRMPGEIDLVIIFPKPSTFYLSERFISQKLISP